MTQVRLTVAGRVVVGQDVANLIFTLPPSAFPTVVNALATVRYAVPPPPTAEDGLAAIMYAVVSAPDSFEAAGEWITRITNEITKAIREEDKK